MKKTDAGKLSTEAQQKIRNQAIRLRKSGRKYKGIAGITGVHEATVCKWYKAYIRDGSPAVSIKRRGRPNGSCRTVTQEQEKELQKATRDKCSDQMKLPFALWTRIAVQQLVKQLRAIEMPIRTVGHYLKRWGFTPQKPLKAAYKQNTETVKAWLDNEYPEIVKRARKEKAEIHWGDETGLCNDSYHGRSYAPRGETPAIKIHPGCKRVNLISSATNQGKVCFMVYKNKMNAQTMIKLMERLIKGAGRKIFLIVDNLKVHHSYTVKDWLMKSSFSSFHLIHRS